MWATVHLQSCALKFALTGSLLSRVILVSQKIAEKRRWMDVHDMKALTEVVWTSRQSFDCVLRLEVTD